MTMPLVLDANGVKFGKTEGNALWLDKNKTSSYELYQYLINSDDSCVIDYLKKLTFLSKEEIEIIEKEHNKAPEKRIAQLALAKEVITFLHGNEEFEEALKVSESLFKGDVKNLSLKEIELGFKGVPHISLKENEILIDMLINNQICNSRREVREFLNAGSITLNGEKVSDENMVITKDLAIEEKVIVIRRGKKKNYIGLF